MEYDGFDGGRKLEGRGVDNVENVPECTDVTICRKKLGRNFPRTRGRKVSDAQKLS